MRRFHGFRRSSPASMPRLIRRVQYAMTAAAATNTRNASNSPSDDAAGLSRGATRSLALHREHTYRQGDHEDDEHPRDHPAARPTHCLPHLDVEVEPTRASVPHHGSIAETTPPDAQLIDADLRGGDSPIRRERAGALEGLHYL